MNEGRNQDIFALHKQNPQTDCYAVLTSPKIEVAPPITDTLFLSAVCVAHLQLSMLMPEEDLMGILTLPLHKRIQTSVKKIKVASSRHVTLDGCPKHLKIL